MALEAWAGGGILGAELDPLGPRGARARHRPHDLLARYVAAGDTEGAEVARAAHG